MVSGSDALQTDPQPRRQDLRSGHFGYRLAPVSFFPRESPEFRGVNPVGVDFCAAPVFSPCPFAGCDDIPPEKLFESAVYGSVVQMGDFSPEEAAYVDITRPTIRQIKEGLYDNPLVLGKSKMGQCVLCLLSDLVFGRMYLIQGPQDPIVFRPAFADNRSRAFFYSLIWAERNLPQIFPDSTLD
jgi:hypothetical protein